MKHNRNITKGDRGKHTINLGLKKYSKKRYCLLFGKYKNIHLKDVPSDYILWLLSSDQPDDVKDFLTDSLT